MVIWQLLLRVEVITIRILLFKRHCTFSMTLFPSHPPGILMVLAWMLCACTALIMAKYYKPMWPNDRLCKERVWFAVHRGLMITVLILTIIAFILIFVHVGEYSWVGWQGFLTWHCVLNPISAMGVLTTLRIILNCT